MMKRMLLLAAATLLALTGCTAATPKITGVTSMAALGDSISVASASCGLQEQCLDNSWSTGTSADVDSHAMRIDQAQGATITVNNDAAARSHIADLAGQIQNAIAQRPDYITILIGANDFCSGSVETMTDPTLFQTTFEQDLATLTAALPNTKIFVSSLPDPINLWSAAKDNLRATQVWSYAGICQSLLANPTDTSTVAQQRRQAVHDRAVAYNAALAAGCAIYPTCRYDNNAVFNYKFKLDDLSTVDYFHPSVQGQRKLAELSWTAGAADLLAG